jgi:hypothetical protein
MKLICLFALFAFAYCGYQNTFVGANKRQPLDYTTWANKTGTK